MATRVMNRTERLSALESALWNSEHGLRAVELAEMSGVDRRTIYRDLALLADYGIPISQHEGKYRLNRDHYRATVRLSFHEAVALMHAAVHLARHASTRSVNLTTAVSKLFALLQAPLKAYVDIVPELRDDSQEHISGVAYLDEICRAWAELRQIHVQYKHRRSPVIVESTICTYFVDVTPGGDHVLVGLDVRSRRVTALRIDLVERVRVLDRVYQIPSNLEDHYRHYVRRLKGGGMHAR